MEDEAEQSARLKAACHCLTGCRGTIYCGSEQIEQNESRARGAHESLSKSFLHSGSCFGRAGASARLHLSFEPVFRAVFIPHELREARRFRGHA